MLNRNVIIVQPSLPAYRRALFQRLSARLSAGFSVYTSRQAELGILDAEENTPPWHKPLGPIRRLFFGLDWQDGALSIPLSRGDILVLCGAPRTLSTLLLLLKAKVKGAVVIWWGHFWSATSRSWRSAIRLSLMQMADAVLFYTDLEIAEYRASWGRAPGKPIYGLNNGIETEEIIKIRQPYQPATRGRDLLFIGRVTGKSQIGLLLEALAQPQCGSLTLDVIGDGEGADLARQRARDLGLDDRVCWHGGLINEPEIAAIANQCKAFVYPGSVGLSLIHAMAYGLPAIVHDDRWTHMPEIAAFSAGETGLSFHKNDVPSLAAALHGILSDEHRLIDFSNRVLAITEESFHAADMTERFLAVIQGAALISGQRKKALHGKQT